ncbi:MAG: sugar phosphate isomerase/epimerase [Candidatus Omnitrophica bacterium]|nr:sugar phosphate isomerase/epimerase [Candidatus Omnitrophota bacterium]
MKILLSNGSFYHFSCEKVAQLAKASGFDGLALMITREFEGRNERELVEKCQKILPVLSIHSPFLALRHWGDPIDKIERSVELCLATGIPLLTFHPPAWLFLEVGFSVWFAGIRDFQEEVGKNRVMVSIENMSRLKRYFCDPHLLSRTASLMHFIEKRNLYLSFDSSHMGTKKADFLEDFDRLYQTGKVKQVQYSDYRDGHEHLRPGRGVLPLDQLLRYLHEKNYSETLCIELFPEEFPKEEEAIVKILRDILREIRERKSRIS